MNFFSLINGDHKKHTANVIFNDERLSAFSRRLRRECLLTSLLFPIAKEAVSSAIKAKKIQTYMHTYIHGTRARKRVQKDVKKLSLF